MQTTDRSEETASGQQQAANPPVSPAPQRPLRWVFDFPLFYKLLLANTLLVAASVALGFWLGIIDHPHEELDIRWGRLFGIGLTSLAAAVAVNYAIVRAALQPLSSLTRLLESLQRGDMGARAERTLFSDPATAGIIDLTNSLLDELAAYRRRLEDLSLRVTDQLEKERNNIARELHDSTAQKLAALLAFQQIIAQTTDDAARAKVIAETKELTRLTLEGVRRLAAGLRPNILDTRGLPGALRWYVREVVDRLLPPVSLDVDDSLGRLPPVAELALYRIAQEALSNISRHARASKVHLTLKRDGDSVLMRLTDDGVGFDMSSPSTNNREYLGLFTIRERARLAGGAAEVTSAPGKGTSIMVRVPLKGPQLG